MPVFFPRDFGGLFAGGPVPMQTRPAAVRVICRTKYSREEEISMFLHIKKLARNRHFGAKFEISDSCELLFPNLFTPCLLSIPSRKCPFNFPAFRRHQQFSFPSLENGGGKLIQFLSRSPFLVVKPRPPLSVVSPPPDAYWRLEKRFMVWGVGSQRENLSLSTWVKNSRSHIFLS